MMDQSRGQDAAQAIRAFLATYDRSSASDRQNAFRIREQLHSELYRREREQYSEFIDHGGES